MEDKGCGKGERTKGIKEEKDKLGDIFDIITKNGESPIRVFICSMVIVLLFALGYFLMGFIYTSPLVTSGSGDAISVPVVIGVKSIIQHDAHHGFRSECNIVN